MNLVELSGAAKSYQKIRYVQAQRLLIFDVGGLDGSEERHNEQSNKSNKMS
jgi:hypothetical protein